MKLPVMLALLELLFEALAVILEGVLELSGDLFIPFMRLDSFIYGFIFALPMAIVRFLYTS